MKAFRRYLKSGLDDCMSFRDWKDYEREKRRRRLFRTLRGIIRTYPLSGMIPPRSGEWYPVGVKTRT